MLLQQTMSKDTTDCSTVSNKGSYHNRIKLQEVRTKCLCTLHCMYQILPVTVVQWGENASGRGQFLMPKAVVL